MDVAAQQRPAWIRTILGRSKREGSAAAIRVVGGVCLAQIAFAAPAVAQLVASNATGCDPSTRCISVTQGGKPSAAGQSIAQCRGKFADFIVPADTIPSGYTGPWFTPELIENATTIGPSVSRPWESFDPSAVGDRLKFLLALRNYAFTTEAVRSLTPNLTADSDYRDTVGGGVDAALRAQKWYPTPRMIYGRPSSPGVREASHGMTLERTVRVNELAGNTKQFRNYAVSYYDARGGHTYQQVWSTATAGKDTADTSAMQIAEGGLVYKLLFSAARPADFPQDILDNSVAVDIIPNAGGQAVSVRLLQIDIAVKDQRAGPTGWYFATYAYDRSVAHTSPWRRMVPVGLMWGNDPSGPPIMESWINPSAPLYARNHLGVDGRLNGPVDNPGSACMSCHSTAQSPSVAQMLSQGTCDVAPHKANWFRNLSGSVAFGRFTPEASGCNTTAPTNTPTAADYSLQLSATVSRSLGPPSEFNPCTWDISTPLPSPLIIGPTEEADVAPVFDVTRDP